MIVRRIYDKIYITYTVPGISRCGNGITEERRKQCSDCSEEKKTDGKPKAIAFVDYEHWYISLDKLFGNMRPDIKAWRDALSEKYEMEEIIFFADFSNPALRQEIPRIREVSNYIIETQNTSTSFKKDLPIS